MRNKGYTKQNKPRYYNSYEGDKGGIVENILNQNFKTEKPYEKCGTDITMFRVNEEAVYLSPIIDFNSREILSYEVGTDAKVVKVLSSAMEELETKMESNKGTIFDKEYVKVKRDTFDSMNKVIDQTKRLWNYNLKFKRFIMK